VFFGQIIYFLLYIFEIGLVGNLKSNATLKLLSTQLYPPQ